MAIEFQETDLMVRMEGGDLIALEAKYHLNSIAGSQKVEDCSDEKKIKARALVELHTYIP